MNPNNNHKISMIEHIEESREKGKMIVLLDEETIAQEYKELKHLLKKEKTLCNCN